MAAVQLRRFTVIAEFRGGTYCNQVRARDADASVFAWLRQLELEHSEIKYLGAKVLEDLNREARDAMNAIVPLSGLQHTWFTMFGTRMGVFRIHIVETPGE